MSLKANLLSTICDLAGDPLLAIDMAALAAGPRTPTSARAGAEQGGTKGVAIIPMHGVLMPRSVSGWFGDYPGMDSLRSAIAAAADDDSVSAIVLSIDSPGGTVAGTMETAATVRAAAERKPVIALADSLAASAAYWIGSQASKFVVAPSADVGSIGVVTMHTDVSRAMSNFGIDVTFVHAGKYKVEGNPYQPLSDEAKANLQERVDEAHLQFVREVAQGRGKTQSAVRETFGEGRTVGAQKALALGMADSIGTLGDVLASLGVGSRAKAQPARRAALI